MLSLKKTDRVFLDICFSSSRYLSVLIKFWNANVHAYLVLDIKFACFTFIHHLSDIAHSCIHTDQHKKKPQNMQIRINFGIEFFN